MRAALLAVVSVVALFATASTAATSHRAAMQARASSVHVSMR